MAPKVTVLMPVYNGTQFLKEAIESVLGQTFSDFEFLVVDDASTDQSADMVRSYSDTRIRLVQNETNLGQVRAQNKGLRLARGAYVARLDQDDSSLPSRLERQVAVLDAEPSVAVVGTWIYSVDSDGQIIDMWQGRVDDRSEYLFAILTNTLPLYHPSVMFRRDSVMELQGYDERVPYCEDQDLWRRLALAGNDARVITEPLTRYRIHEGQQSVSDSEDQSKNHVLSQERFIHEFAGGTQVRPLRLLMTCGSGMVTDFWDVCPSPRAAREFCRQLDCMLGHMMLQLQLKPWQCRRLEQLMRHQAAKAAARAWRHDVLRQWVASYPVYLFSLRGGISAATSFHAWIYPLVYFAAPMLLVLRKLKRMVSRSVHIRRWLGDLRERARRLYKIYKMRHWH